MKSKLTVDELKINGYEFSGIVDTGERHETISGEFAVEWDGTYPIVSITHIELSHLGSYNLIDFEALERKIESKDNGNWYDDYMNRISERTGS